jgi:hypothetical protein
MTDTKQADLDARLDAIEQRFAACEAKPQAALNESVVLHFVLTNGGTPPDDVSTLP